MGSDDLNLRVLSTSSDDPKERKAAAKVLRLLARGRHWVLVVLLLGNVVSPYITTLDIIPYYHLTSLGSNIPRALPRLTASHLRSSTNHYPYSWTTCLEEE